MSQSIELGQLATAACLLEIAAPKPGNVHPGADFEDMTFDEMCLGAVAIGPYIGSAPQVGIGNAVLAAVHATQQAVGKNTNLGTILLLAPLACLNVEEPWTADTVLQNLTKQDALDVFQAIRLANPGGLGTPDSYDVARDAPDRLLDAMSAAADRDIIARQYANGFKELRTEVMPLLQSALLAGYDLPTAIVYLQMQLLARFPDSLIARKCGQEMALESSRRAGDVLALGKPDNDAYANALADFDAWLRADGHARNPGTTADLIAAGLFLALRSGILDRSYAAAILAD